MAAERGEDVDPLGIVAPVLHLRVQQHGGPLLGASATSARRAAAAEAATPAARPAAAPGVKLWVTRPLKLSPSESWSSCSESSG